MKKAPEPLGTEALGVLPMQDKSFYLTLRTLPGALLFPRLADQLYGWRLPELVRPCKW